MKSIKAAEKFDEAEAIIREGYNVKPYNLLSKLCYDYVVKHKTASR